MVEAFGVEQLSPPPVEVEKRSPSHWHHKWALDMGAGTAEPVERHQVDARNAGERRMLGRDRFPAPIGGDAHLHVVDARKRPLNRLALLGHDLLPPIEAEAHAPM